MNWRLIFLLSLSGIIIGVTGVYFLPARFEAILETPVFIVYAYILARYTERKFFLQGFILGVISTIWVTIVHVTMAEKYLITHIVEAKQYAKMTLESGATARQAMFAIGIFKSLLSGLVVGLFSFAAEKIIVKIRNQGM